MALHNGKDTSALKRMKSKMIAQLVYGVFLSFAFYTFVHSQNTLPACENDGPRKNCVEQVISNRLGNMQTLQPNPGDSTESSPWPVPKITDHDFNKSTLDGVLDRYTCRDGSPLTINIPVKRVVTKFERGSGQYQDFIGWHTNNGTLSSLKITLPVFDIDSTEVDKVYFNGEYIGNLYGKNEAWELNEFNVPISKVNFGKFNGIGSPPTDGDNVITIEIDTLDGGWCTSIDWTKISFETLSPIVLIHGNGSDHGFYYRRGFVQTLNNQRMLFESSLDMPMPGNYIEQVENAVGGIPNNRRIQAHLRAVANAFGVDSMHVVMHSKGGLDTRSYLANLYSEDKENFKVLSYTSLSTPHNGSILADLSYKYAQGIEQTRRSPEFQGFTGFQGVLAAMNNSVSGFTKGQENLTTSYVAGFNQRNIPRLRGLTSEMDFYTIAADADNNGNGELDTLNCENEGLLAEGLFSGLPDCTPTLGSTNAMYQILKKTKSIELSYVTRMISVEPGIEYPGLVPLLTGIPNSTYELNDTLVTVNSGHGQGSIFSLVDPSRRKTFRAGEGKNHSSVANGMVAIDVLVWIIGTEGRKGDLRPSPE